MKIKKIVPTIILAAALGLGVNSCVPDKKEEVPIIEQPAEIHTINNIEYQIMGEEIYKNSDKSFSVSSKVKITDLEKDELKEIKVQYTCDTDTKGEFSSETVSLNRKDLYTSINIHSDGIIDFILIYNSTLRRNKLMKMDELSPEDRAKYTAFGEKQIELYKNMFDIEDKKLDSKGWSIYKEIDKIDLTNLKEKDFEETSPGSLEYRKDGQIVFAQRRDKSKKILYLWVDGPGEASLSMYDEDIDGKSDKVIIGQTEFYKEDGQYIYIKDLYTIEEVKDIFSKTDKQLSHMNEITKKIEIQPQKDMEERILDEYD
ncbi:MAG: hypothetical protein KKA79_05345 [Nanoarchaeota archaeon]|nr:hypothetical protein [Nanoarchaeota archaeon]MCG2718184.1 hypothetical protein [Nanoarchaeota archaeon]